MYMRCQEFDRTSTASLDIGTLLADFVAWSSDDDARPTKAIAAITVNPPFLRPFEFATGHNCPVFIEYQ